MNKADFLHNLELLLAKLPPTQKAEVLAYYDDIISTSIKDGQVEAKVIEELGPPAKIARYHIAKHLIDIAEFKLTTPSFFKVINATLRLGISNLALLTFPLLGIAGAYLALVGTSLVAIITALSLLIGEFVKPFTVFHITVPAFFYENTVVSIGTFFLAIGLFAFGLLFLIGTYILLRIFYHGTINHLRFHLFTNKGER
ncbi:MAG: DUF1700 domain-containing protein [Syntrophomonadaceae bacterium]|nr:DUF1700 domain-containing protein [Syntrophomonadaceae bacterium]